mgnify:CR=1 FL=1
MTVTGTHLDKDPAPALEAVDTTADKAFKTVETHPDPWEPDDYPTPNIYLVASDHARIEQRHEGDPRQAQSLAEAIARMQPYPVEEGVILTDDAAPLEPLVRRTVDHLRYQSRYYLPSNVLFN